MTISFWLILFAIFIWGLIHSILASLAVKSRARLLFGPAADRWYRLAFNFLAIITLLPILLLVPLLNDKKIYTITFPWVILSLVLQFLAVIVLVVGLRQTGIGPFLGLQQVLFPGDSAPPVLITNGLYRYVRHPLYAAGLVFIWFSPVLTWNLLAMNFGLTIYLIIGATFEERKLLREFGEAYAEYRRRTPMLIPGLVIPRTG
jgi:protein-S-isoprenylcysteine O-methyltransferase Ste14